MAPALLHVYICNTGNAIIKTKNLEKLKHRQPKNHCVQKLIHSWMEWF